MCITNLLGVASPVKSLDRACTPGASCFGGVMFPYVVLGKDKAWQPGPYEGVELMILHKHESTGGVVVLRKFKAGHRFPRTLIQMRTNGLTSCPANGRNPASPTPPERCFLRPKASVTARKKQRSG